MEWIINQKPVEYPDALARMEERVQGIIDVKMQEAVWLLEHPPLYTKGTSAKASDLLDNRFPVFDAGRGGEYTYHGPGQLVAYAMLDLKQRHKGEPDLRKYVWQLEEWIIQTLGLLGVTGERREGRIGIWVETGNTEAKIAAIGIRIRKWVSFHGISININPDLSHFNGIVPCGIKEYGVTSLKTLQKTTDKQAVIEALKTSFKQVFI